MAYFKSEENKVNPRKKQIDEMKQSYFFSDDSIPLMQAIDEDAPLELEEFTNKLLDFCDNLYADYISEKINLNELKIAIEDELKDENIRSISVLLNVAFGKLRERVFNLEELNLPSTNRNGMFNINFKPDDDSDKKGNDMTMPAKGC